MKVFYLIDDISQLGGAEKVTITKLNYLATNLNWDIYLIIQRKNEHFFEISERIVIIYLDILTEGLTSKLASISKIIKDKFILFRKICSLIQIYRPSIIVSIGNEFVILPMLKYYIKFFKKLNIKIIRELHYSIPQYNYYSANSLFYKVIHKFSSLVRHKVIFRFYDIVITLSNEDKEKYWKNNAKLKVIPNPLTVKSDLKSNLSSKNVIALGRLVDMKNFSSLIRSFKFVHDQHHDWHLTIYGEGPLKQKLIEEINELGLNGIVLVNDRVKEVEKIYYQSSICVVPSLCEAFCLVITESMHCGVPVIAYNCPCGPKEIIDDNVNGYLIPLNDEKTLAKKITYLIEHDTVRFQMGKNAIKKSEDFSIAKIMVQWIELFEDLLSKN